MNPFDAVKSMSDNEVERCAKFDINSIHPSLVELVGAARGEFNERRVVRVAKTLPMVEDAWRASRFEDVNMATDAFVRLKDGKTIRLQIKSRSSGFSRPSSKKRSKMFGCFIIRAPILVPDEDIVRRLRILIKRATGEKL